MDNKEKKIYEMSKSLPYALCPHELCPEGIPEDTNRCNYCRAEALYNVGYRKQVDTAQEILRVMEADIKAAMKSNRNVMAARERIDDVWNACSGKIDACLGILQKLKEVVAQFGVEVKE